MSLEKMTRHGLRSMLLVGACLGVALLAKTVAKAEDDPTRVATRQGVVQGAIEDGLAVFKGIPYAAPPVGPLRWKPPQPAPARDSVLDATAFGPGCTFLDGSKFLQGRWITGKAGDIFVDIPPAPSTSEDCLRLNIWAPADAEGAAVMVWLQPQLASSTALFDGAAFARDGVIFVSLDYRQLSLGNFAHPALTAEAAPDEPLGRYQTMDQMAALRWVKENIAAFGGDPDNVTVLGQSASGASVLQLLTIPEAEGLFDKAIVQSGGGWSRPWSLEQLERLGALEIAHAGLPADATAEQLRALPLAKLPQNGLYSIDGRLQPEGAAALIDRGELLDVPLLIGWTDNDGSSLRSATPESIVEAASDELRRAYAADGASGADLGRRMYTDGHVAAPARWIAGQAADGAPSYLYVFSYVATAARGTKPGASHGDDLPYVFDSWDAALPQLRLSEEDRAATRMMHGCWIAFARTGAPACEGVPEWPRYTRETDQLMELGIEPHVRERFRAEQLDAQEAAWRAGAEEAALVVETELRKLEETRLGAP